MSVRHKVLHTFWISLEWRLIAFAITNIFFWVTTGQFWKATGLALLLHFILFFVYLVWHFTRNELHLPLVPKATVRKAMRKKAFSS